DGKATGDGATDNFAGHAFKWHAEGTAADGSGGGSYGY
ncbi:MAG: hypothetical protein QOE60_1617, partial [Thermoleophilaceae bacterium]|nr:hypothetical protein [Thermoleophilaceae bacterium]